MDNIDRRTTRPTLSVCLRGRSLLDHNLSLSLVQVSHSNMDHIVVPLSGHGVLYEAGHWPDCSRLVLGPRDGENLEGSCNRHNGTTPPSKSSKADMRADPVQIACDRRCNGTASCTRGSGEAVDLAKDRGGCCSFFEEDEEDWVCEYAKEVANSQADIDAWIQRIRREEGQVWNDEVSDRVEDSDHDKGLPNPKPGREEREKYSLDEKGNKTVDGHDDPDRLGCKTEATRDVEGRLRDTAGGDPIVLQKDGEKVVVGHAVVGEDAKRDDYHGYLSSEDFWHIFRGNGRAISVYPPFFRFANVDGIECAVGVGTKIDSIISCGPSSHERRFHCGMVQLLLCTPWLHIWMSLNQEEVTKEDADQEYRGAYEIRKEEREASKDAGVRENGRHGDGRSGKGATNCRANYRTDRPNEWHHSKRSCYILSTNNMWDSFQGGLTFMLGLLDQFADHCLDDSNVSICPSVSQS